MTVKEYLQKLINEDGTGVLRNTITSFGLEEVALEEFEKRFGKMETKEMSDFILDPRNNIRIGMWSLRIVDEGKLPADERGFDPNGRRRTAPTYGEYQDR